MVVKTMITGEARALVGDHQNSLMKRTFISGVLSVYQCQPQGETRDRALC